MGTLSRSSFMAAAIAGLGLGGIADRFDFAGAMAPPTLAYQSIGRRSRTPGKPRPSGSKLARKAGKGKVGIARIH